MKYTLDLASPFPVPSPHPLTPDTRAASCTKVLFHILLYLEWIGALFVCLYVEMGSDTAQDVLNLIHSQG